MKIYAVFAVGTLLLSACSAAERGSDTASVDNGAAATNSMATDEPANATLPNPAPATAASAAEYATMAGMGDLYEIESSRLAVARGQSAPLKQFAQQMITDHQATTRQIQRAAAEAGMTVSSPTALDARRAEMIEALQTAQGADFDRIYRDQQVTAHREALALHEGFARSGDTDALKTVAGTIAPKVRDHLAMLENMDLGR